MKPHHPNTHPLTYKPMEVVFIKTNQQTLLPSKVHLKSSYGTYLVHVYGNNDMTYVAEYAIIPFADHQATKTLSSSSPKNKKLMKYLKCAEKDHAAFIKQKGQLTVNNTLKSCKQEEDKSQECSLVPPDQDKGKPCTKYEAIRNISVENLV
jgi:hypothetical protein